VIVDLVRESPGEEPDTHQGVSIDIGAPANPPGFDDEVIGMAVGDAKTFTIRYPEDYSIKELAATSVAYTVTLKGLKKRVVPALDDEFARAVSEGETVETLREKVRARLRHEKEADRRRKFRRTILDALLSRRDVPAPEVLVESETAAALRDYARYLASSGVDPQKEDWRKLAEEARPGAERRVKEYLLLDAIAEREGLQVSETELEAEFRRAAAARGVEPAVLREQMAGSGGIDALRDEMRLARAVDLLIASAKVLPSGMPVDVK